MRTWWSEHALPRLTDRICGQASIAELRAPVCSGLHGDVVEIGFGSGHNVAHYPAAVRSVAAVEPSDLAWSLSAGRRDAVATTVRRAGLDGGDLALADDSVDCALSTFTLCTVPDAARALAELRRVLRPGGTLHLLEHGLAPDPAVARWQRRANAVQRRLAGGCTLDVPLLDLLAGAGFDPRGIDRRYGGVPKAMAALYVGVAPAG